jgi:hypothetical protein
MALHRDIYWIGRQWAVTGYGLQLIDQRLKGVFDIEITRLRDQRVLDAMRAHEWLKAEDFDKALAAAHKRFPEAVQAAPERIKAALPVEMVLKMSEPALPASTSPPATEKFRSPVLGLNAESAIPKAAAPGRPGPCAETPLVATQPTETRSVETRSVETRSVETRSIETLSFEPVSAAPPKSPAAPGLPLQVRGPGEGEMASAELLGKQALSAELQFWPRETDTPAAKSPLSALELRIASERAKADLESKMSALDGLLRSRGFVAKRTVSTQPSIPAVQAEGELAKFAPQWRVRT